MRIVCADYLNGLRGVESGSVSLVLTDPPQGITRAGFDTKPCWSEFWSEVWRILEPTGVAVVLAGNGKVAAEIIASDPYFRYDLVWVKNRASGFLNAKVAPLRSHEWVLVFYRKTGAYTAVKSDGHAPMNAATRVGVVSENYGDAAHVTKSEAGTTRRYPKSVLRHAAVSNIAKARIHAQQKPVGLGRCLVSLYSGADDLVVDPFAGSGSFGEAALLENRRFVGFDSDSQMAQAAEERLSSLRPQLFLPFCG